MATAVVVVGIVLPARAEPFDFTSLNTFVDALGAPIEERPLFSPDRRPPLAPQVPEPVAKVEPSSPAVASERPDNWRLLGIVRGDDREMIVVLDTTNNEKFQLAVGDSRDGWELLRVRPRKADLARNEKIVVLGFPSDDKK
jgi:general secretion pathway protein N